MTPEHDSAGFLLPERLATTLAHAGLDAAAWGERLPGLVAETATAWGLTIGEPYAGGSWSLVLEATRGGEACVLKMVLPDQSGHDQIRVLEAAHGRGVVRLLAADVDRGAMLLERLEPAPSPSWDETPAQIARALGHFWEATRHLAADPSSTPAHQHKAAGLIGLIDDLRHHAEPRHQPVVDRARALAEERLAAHDPRRDVFCHGDPHPGNLMLRPLPTGDSELVLVDADGISGCEPEYDLGVILRSWIEVIESADDPHALLTTKADELAALTATDAAAIVAWATIERVTTGLYLRHLGHDGEGLSHLDTAVRLLELRTPPQSVRK